MKTASLKIIALIPSLFVLQSCMSQWDMQGTDPKEYYAEHPIKNSVEMHTQSYTVHFDAGESRLSPDEVDTLRAQLRDISMLAVQSVRIQLSKIDMNNEARREHLSRMLRSIGYNKGHVLFEFSPKQHNDNVRIELTYAQVVSPDCPDWRRSPVTTYSNTSQGNFNCAQEVNTGLMVADPEDLVRGSGDLPPVSSERADKVLQDYRNGAAAAASGASSGSGATSSTTTTTTGN